jgi:hypothetical protein
MKVDFLSSMRVENEAEEKTTNEVSASVSTARTCPASSRIRICSSDWLRLPLIGYMWLVIGWAATALNVD